MLSEPVLREIRTKAGHGAPGAAGGDPAPAVVPLVAPLPLDLGAIGKPLAMQPLAPRVGLPSPAPDPQTVSGSRSRGPDHQSGATLPAPTAPRYGSRRKGLSLDLAELVPVVEETADPLLAAELARRTAPPPLPEPSPQALPPAEPALSPPPLTPGVEAPLPAEAGLPEPRPANTAPPAGLPALPRPAPVPSPATAGPVGSRPLSLTPEQQARLAALPASSRDLVLFWLQSGDPILLAEARKKLAPPRPQPEAPQTLPELLARIREDPSYPALAASGLAQEFHDAKSWAAFKARCEEAWRGELPVARLVSAYEQATGPQARNRGALFMYALRGDTSDG